MSEWKITRVSQMAEILSGGTPKTEVEEYWNGNIPWLSVKDFAGDTRKVYDSEKHISELGLNSSATQLLYPGDLIISARGTVGEIAQIGKTSAFNQSCYGLRVADGYSSDYLYYMLKYQVRYLKSVANGAVFDTIVVKTFDRMKASVPDLPTQARIADILSTYDDLIENNNRRIALLEKAAQDLYKEWFVRFRFPGYENAEFKEKKPFGWSVSSCEKTKIPSGFDYCEFSELGSFTRGRNITAAEMVEGEIPVVSAGLQPSGYHNEANVMGRSLTVSASGANAGYLQYNHSDIWAADCAYYQDEKNLWFVYCTLKFLQPVISNLQCGAAQPHVYPKNINKLCVLKPTEELITKFNQTVEPFFDEIETLKKKNDNLIKQRDLLLPRLMSGKLEV